MVDPDFSKFQYEALLQLLRTTDTLWNSSRLLFARWDISPAQFNVLNLLSDEVRGLTQSQLGKALLTHRSNVTGLVGRLEKRSLVKRSADMGDQRAWRVVLTSDGRKLLRSVLPIYDEAARRVWAGFPSTKRKRYWASCSSWSVTRRRQLSSRRLKPQLYEIAP
jgi:DNA-binding MarR family transcriptional regulator